MMRLELVVARVPSLAKCWEEVIDQFRQSH
jgi:hypothetical protein